MKRLWISLMIAALLAASPVSCVHAETEHEVWTLTTQDGQQLTQIAAPVTVGDEYIAQDNRTYRVSAVDEASHRATVQETGQEAAVAQAFFPFVRALAAEKRIGLYCTHSDESYENGDGAYSLEESWAGIHDVAATLKSWLEDKDVTVEFNTDSFLPHDAGAYRRSRAAAMELAKSGPAAIFDIHRDGIPDASEYETEVDGEKVTKVRLLVGRSNPNSAENKQFAVQLKSVADEAYPGLIKDIFIGKGNYNQELMPDSVLLEFGTHTSDKDQVLASTQYMADVINMTVFGGAQGYSQKAQRAQESESQTVPGAVSPPQNSPGTAVRQSAQTETQQRSGSGVWIAIAIIVGLAVVAVVGFGALSGRGFSGLGESMKRFSSEVTGGLFGKKPRE